MRALFDSNILIDYLRGIPQARDELAHRPNACISLLTWIEVMVGVRDPADVAPTRDFLARFTLIQPDMKIAALAVQLRQTWRRLRLPDALIWASARAHGMPLVTRDVGDYPNGETDVLIPYRLAVVHETAGDYAP